MASGPPGCQAGSVNSIWKRLALVAVALCAAAASAEVGLRLFRPVAYRRPLDESASERRDWNGRVHRPSATPGLVYELSPSVDLVVDGMHVVTNSLGMRCKEPLPSDTPNLLRVVVVGDSMAFGYGVQQGEDFPAGLERSLRGACGDQRTVEVLNLAVGGYSLADELAVLRERALPLHPDLIVFAYCLNDPELEAIQPLQAYFRDEEWWQHSHALRFVASRLRGRAIARFGGGDKWRALHNPEGPFWREAAPLLEEFAATCRSCGIPTVAVVLPFLTGEPFDQPVREYSYQREHEFLAREFERLGLETFDTLEVLAPHPPRETILGTDDIHLTARGNELVAGALCERVLRHVH